MQVTRYSDDAIQAQRTHDGIMHQPLMIMPRHDNGQGIKCYPRPSVLNVRLSRRRPLSKSNTFDQNFMKLGHIV